ncbi:hypothetical protein GFL69_23810 [Rhizobium leguminosarum bv. viciae]|nr:hypothetical protein [Rhizobium leguminosarum bv. viciae]
MKTVSSAACSATYTTSASSSALCRGSATYQPAVDARDKPEHDERAVAACLRLVDVRYFCSGARNSAQ